MKQRIELMIGRRQQERVRVVARPATNLDENPLDEVPAIIRSHWLRPAVCHW